MRFRFRCYPTSRQESELARTFGACRYVYNWALRLRTDSYRAGKTISYAASSAELTRLKRQADHSWLNEVSSVPLQQSLRHLQTAYRNFFDKRAGYPVFKKKHGPQAAEYTRSAFRWDAANRNLSLAKIGRLRIRWSRDFKSAPTTVTITKDCAGRYFVVLVLDETVGKLPRTGQAVGLDLGICRMATLSNGERIANPKYLSRRAKQLARAQRVLVRRKVGSKRREKQRLRVARIQAKIADCRSDHLHKITTALVRRFDVIVMEDLNLRGMIRNHCLARSLSDVSFGTIRSMLAYKCEWYGKTLKYVDRFFPSSKRCHVCGHILESLPLSVREWTCPECRSQHDRDENAAKNVLAAGHAVTARGGRGRRSAATAVKRSAHRTVNQPALSSASHSSPGIRSL